MNVRPYDPEKDREAVQRIWKEIHWIDDDDKDDARSMDLFLAESRVLVADVNDQAECMVSSAPGTIMHLENELSLSIVAAVTTSLVARKLGLASQLTAQLVAQDAAEGLDVAALGMFEQGFYSRLGFGTGPYEHKVQFNPAHLKVSRKAGVPERLNEDHYKDIHSALMHRWRTHGSVQVFPPGHARGEIIWTDNPVGFGYRDEKGELTHFIWGELKDEYGPFKINAMAYRNRDQLMELLALIGNFGDQVYMARMVEPVHVQLQDLLDEPFRNQNISGGGKYEALNSAEAFSQIRINNLESCLKKTSLPNREPFAFNLRLDDPITQYLPEDQTWRGIGGDYSLVLGPECSATPGFVDSLPILEASVGGFSRLWLGCASANAIATCGEISGAQEMLDELEKVLSLPLPKTGWEF
ncbi:MAG: GNAT family N-acetyltransferase [Pseudomonadales bacterium]|nr:GNAT family N-acetyltransferase [Pseudomonadales bacterium]